MARKHERPSWVGNRPEIAKYVSTCRGCDIQGRIVDPVPPGTPYAHWLKEYYPPLHDGLCDQCFRVLGPLRDPAALPQDTPPTHIGAGEVLRFAVIDDDVRPTGSTKHSYGQVVDGEVVPGQRMEPFCALAIVRYKDDEGIYLLYLDSDWQEVTDTWHKTLDDAIHQAEFEYEGITAKLRPPSN